MLFSQGVLACLFYLTVANEKSEEARSYESVGRRFWNHCLFTHSVSPCEFAAFFSAFMTTAGASSANVAGVISIGITVGGNGLVAENHIHVGVLIRVKVVVIVEDVFDERLAEARMIVGDSESRGFAALKTVAILPAIICYKKVDVLVDDRFGFGLTSFGRGDRFFRFRYGIGIAQYRF